MTTPLQWLSRLSCTLPQIAALQESNTKLSSEANRAKDKAIQLTQDVCALTSEKEFTVRLYKEAQAAQAKAQRQTSELQAQGEMHRQQLMEIRQSSKAAEMASKAELESAQKHNAGLAKANAKLAKEKADLEKRCKQAEDGLKHERQITKDLQGKVGGRGQLCRLRCSHGAP